MSQINRIFTMTRKREVLHLLRQAEKPLSPSEIADVVEISANYASQLLKELRGEGLADNPEHGNWVALRISHTRAENNNAPAPLSEGAEAYQTAQAYPRVYIVVGGRRVVELEVCACRVLSDIDVAGRIEISSAAPADPDTAEIEEAKAAEAEIREKLSRTRDEPTQLKARTLFSE